MTKQVKLKQRVSDHGEVYTAEREVNAMLDLVKQETEKQNTHQWRWCLVGNIAESHEYGENQEIRIGTKQFMPGAKIYLAPAQWGDGYEKVVVIGKPRRKRSFIEIVMRRKYITDYRLQKVFRPAVLERMEKSEYLWWDSTDADRNEIIKILDLFNPAAAKKAKHDIKAAEGIKVMHSVSIDRQIQ